MSRLALSVLLVFLLLGCNDRPDSDSPSLPGIAGPIAIESVTVVPLDEERTVPDQTVLLNEGDIVAVGPSGEVQIPEDATFIDGTGQYLMPGLAEMHAHLPTEDNPEGIRDAVLFLFASQGITYARGMVGAPDHPEMRDSIASGDRFGPTLRVGSPFLSGDVETADEARERVREYANVGYDFLKIGDGLGTPAYEALVDEAQTQELEYAGHVADDVGLVRSLELGHNTVDHLDNYVEALRTDTAPDNYQPLFGVTDLLPYLDRDRIDRVVESTEETGAGVVPTMVLWETFFDDHPVDQYEDQRPEVRYLPSSTRENWASSLRDLREGMDAEAGQEVIALRKELLRALYDGDVAILLGSDAPQIYNVPGFSAHREMEYMQEEVGMSPYDILVSGSRAVAEFYGAENTFGTVEEGKRADLILVENDPLEDVRHASEIAGVVVQGRWLSDTEIQDRLNDIEAQFE